MDDYFFWMKNFVMTKKPILFMRRKVQNKSMIAAWFKADNQLLMKTGTKRGFYHA
jgi:hypothetical protein